ncbi:MAG: SMI1/KNR4 family protein [Granulosicoccus sp.]
MLEKFVRLIEDKRSSPVLNDGASQSDIEGLAKLLPVELSSSLVELYTEADGENYTEDDWSSSAPSLFCEYTFIGIKDVVSEYKYNLSLYEELYSFDPDGYQCFPEGTVKAHVFHPHWVPFASFGGGTSYLAVDHAPDEKGIQNQVVAFGRDLSPCVYQVAYSLQDALDMIFESKKRNVPDFTNELRLSYPESLHTSY